MAVIRQEPMLDPSTRLLCGPGPANVPDSVLEALQKPMLGHLDGEFHAILDQVVSMLERTYRRETGLTLPLSSTGTMGMEVGIASLVTAGDVVVVGIAGFFGQRIADLARRRGATVVEVRVEPGNAVPNERLLDAIAEHPETRLVAVVHAETSTGVRQPVRELAEELRGSDVLTLVDCVTSLGGIELEAEAWGLDYCYSCTQKCLGAPPGLSPISLSERALERARSLDGQLPYTFDVERLAAYWIRRPATYHHTVPVLQIYALHEALRLVLEEGLPERWLRHAEVGTYLQDQLRQRALDLLADPAHQLPQLTAVRVPDGIDGRAIQQTLLSDFGIEVGGSLDASGPQIWRIGTMGVNATQEIADRLLAAFDHVL